MPPEMFDDGYRCRGPRRPARPASATATLLAVTAAIMGVVAVWWWALLGMTAEVGYAVMTTVSTAAVASIVIATRPPPR